MTGSPESDLRKISRAWARIPRDIQSYVDETGNCIPAEKLTDEGVLGMKRGSDAVVVPEPSRTVQPVLHCLWGLYPTPASVTAGGGAVGAGCWLSDSRLGRETKIGITSGGACATTVTLPPPQSPGSSS